MCGFFTIGKRFWQTNRGFAASLWKAMQQWRDAVAKVAQPVRKQIAEHVNERERLLRHSGRRGLRGTRNTC